MMFVTFIPEFDGYYKDKKKHIITELEWITNDSIRLERFICPNCGARKLYNPPNLWFISCSECFTSHGVDEILEAN
jgi:hypothetical protein